MFRVELYKEPLKIKDLLPVSGGPEMQPDESAFICGLIKQKRPRTILEVGVAGGGTTAIILNCLSLLDIDATLHSVDIAEKYYQNPALNTGYLAEAAKEVLESPCPHVTHYGKTLPECMEQIGGGIDFLILDTIHTLPGELLDFLVCLDKLEDGAVVVMHDVLLPYWTEVRGSLATMTLLSSVVAEKKYLNYDIMSDDIHDYLSVGAFELSAATRNHIQNVFLALLIPWFYMPDDKQIALYQQYYQNKYDKNLVSLFEMAVKLNERTKESMLPMRKSRVKTKDFSMLAELVELCKKTEHIYIYGHGKYGKALGKFLSESGIIVKGYVISDNQPRQEDCVYISNLRPSDDCMILLGLSSKHQDNIVRGYKDFNFRKVEQPVLDLVTLVK